jgi:2,3-bisphosphoglycerate-independent phosphoglycerate mutase
MIKTPTYPIVLTILDGWGHSDNLDGNAIKIACTPTIDALMTTYPLTLLNASGIAVGLPAEQVGNSEVGHASIGGGRVLPQDLVRISSSIEDHSFFRNKVLEDICTTIRQSKTKLHLIGLCSNGGVHSHIKHLLSLLDLVKSQKNTDICIHFIADGRDTSASCCQGFLELLMEHMKKIGIGRICTISGRYYSMDRDCRWGRTEAFYKVLTEDDLTIEVDPVSTIIKFYEQGISDEFITPTRIAKGSIESGDGIIFFNFRPDRMRQLIQPFSKKGFKAFKTKNLTHLQIATFTRYDSQLSIPIAFKPLEKENFLGEVVSRNNLKQLRIAETEKYAHVTYFFNGGVEEPFTGEDRELIPSPQVKTYDESPEMSAKQITRSIIAALEKKIYSLIIINYANPDMIGHTGNLNATIRSIEALDKCMAEVLDAVSRANGTLLITADHGNAECMIDSQGRPSKSHTINPVPFILIEGEKNKIEGHGGAVQLRKNGSLADIAPTIIDILKLDKPIEMTGTSLIEKPLYQFHSNSKIIA